MMLNVIHQNLTDKSGEGQVLTCGDLLELIAGLGGDYEMNAMVDHGVCVAHIEWPHLRRGSRGPT